jgi:hypothetical protein
VSTATIVPAVLLAAALVSLAVALWTWSAGGKRHVLSSLILTAIATSMLQPAGSGRKTAAMSVAGGLIAAVLITTPRARIFTMRVELVLFTAAIAVIWALELFPLSDAFTMAGLLLLAVLVLCAYGAMIVRANKERKA